MKFSPLTRQMFIALPTQLTALAVGGSFGFPGVLLEHMKSNDGTKQLTIDTLSWIASLNSIAGLGALLMPSIMQKIGRKQSFILCCIILTIGWLVAFISNSVLLTIIAECFLGLGCNCIIIVNFMTISEMLAPKYRTLVMMTIEFIQAIGIVLVNVLGDFVKWNMLALMMCSLVIISLMMSLRWPESPPWLAYKGRYDECEESFLWTRGRDSESEKELQAMIAAQKEEKARLNKESHMKTFIDKFKRRDFNKPALFMFLLFVNLFMSGGIALLTYSRYVTKLATKDEKVGTISFYLNDIDLLIGGIVALVMSSRYKNKTILNLASFRLIFLYGCALILYLQKLDLISQNPWLFTACFQGSAIVSCSCLNVLSFALATDLMPVKHRGGIGGAMLTFMSCLFLFITNKLLPYLLIWLDIWGTFLLFGVNGTFCQILIWKYLPETRHRTLQEIEDYYNNGGFDKRRDDDLDVNVPIAVGNRSD